MKLTKARLKRIIKEELGAVLDGDGNDDLMDELFPEDSLMQEELTILTIALGTALGILAYKLQKKQRTNCINLRPKLADRC